jgi:acetoacetyl-CoA synthetase
LRIDSWATSGAGIVEGRDEMTGIHASDEILWRPPSDVLVSTNMGRYLAFLRENRGLDFADYPALWRWSVDSLGEFWSSVAEYSGVRFHDSPSAALVEQTVEGARWFPGATLNFAEFALDGPDNEHVIVARSEARDRVVLSRGELRDQVSSLRATLLQIGVRSGDRVVAYLPNIPEALVVLYAAASIGAVFAACAPESGARMAISKFAQLEPTVLVTVDGYIYGGSAFERDGEVARLRAALPTLAATIAIDYLHPGEDRIPDAMRWADAAAKPEVLEFLPVSFDHPLYIVFSSGTTGVPKAIIHRHGGIVLEHFKLFVLHEDLQSVDRWFWFSSTNWMAWNYSASVLFGRGSIFMLDGHPMRPTLASYWEMIAEEQITSMGTSPSFLLSCMNAGLVPGAELDLSRLRNINCGGSPLTAELFRWVYRALSPTVYLASGSGGTDVASSFVSGTRLLPVRAGEIACRLLGVDAHAYDDNGSPVIGQRGELVVTKPMPSMPLGLWRDDDGSRMHDAYFGRFPGVWCHGDWVTFTAEGTCRVTGRSDATLNRGGVRLGTSDFYAALGDTAGVTDSLVIHLEDPSGGPGRLVLFVATEDGAPLPPAAAAEMRSRLGRELSPRHAPDDIVTVSSIPATPTGKKMEVPVKRAILEPDYGEPGDGLDEFRTLRSRLRPIPPAL